MKTILHLSLVLMLIAGSSGAINFIKMCRSGEIEKLYDKNDPPTIAHLSPAPGTVNPFEPAKPLIHATNKNAPKISEKSNQYPSTPMKNIAVDITVATLQPTDTIETASASIVRSEDDKSTTPIFTTDHQKEKPVKEKPQAKKKFKLSMYSRGMIREEDVIDESDSAAISAIDTSVAKTTFSQ